MLAGLRRRSLLYGLDHPLTKGRPCAGIITDLGSEALIVTAAGVVGPLVLFWLVRGSALRFLFERPGMFWLATKPKSRLAIQPAN